MALRAWFRPTDFSHVTIPERGHEDRFRRLAAPFPAPSRARRMADSAGRLDELGEHAAAVLGVQEIDPRPHRAVPRAVVQHPYATGAGDAVGLVLDVAVGAERDVMQALAPA